MVVADDAGDLPGTVFELPKHDGFRFADVARVARMVEAVGGKFDCAVVRQRMNLQGAGDEFARDFAADVVLDGFYELVFADG